MPISYAPSPVPFIPERFYESVFLAGSIEMDKAERWQDRATDVLSEYFLLYNPRRPDWDSAWDPNGHEMVSQITWEQNRMETASVVFFYFDPNTKSPITLLELGQCLGSMKRIFVVCPDGFYRKTNVIVTCNRYGVPVCDTLEEGLSVLLKLGTDLDYTKKVLS